jgi:hypothetical protein
MDSARQWLTPGKDSRQALSAGTLRRNLEGTGRKALKLAPLGLNSDIIDRSTYHSARALRMRTPQARSVCTLRVRISCARSASALRTRTSCAHFVCALRVRTPYARSVCALRMRALYVRSVCALCIRTPHAQSESTSSK